MSPADVVRCERSVAAADDFEPSPIDDLTMRLLVKDLQT